ncbi:MAG: carboxypeptidase-like regulatory domain-containing protein [Planctomycetota bacterium]|nr:carboxypeptidase-like regulatory domain-containing protein [Planctomycetota bacterium]
MQHRSALLYVLTAVLILVLGGWWMSMSGSHESGATTGRQSTQDLGPLRGAVLEPVSPDDARAEVAPPSAEPPAGASADLEPEVAPTAAYSPTLSGRVVDEEGFTVTGAEVRIWTNSWSLGDPAVTVVSGANGEFSASGFGPKFVAAAFSPDMVCVSGLRGDLAEGTVCEGLELILAPAAVLFGTVEDAKGSPAEGATLHLANPLRNFDSTDGTETPGVTTFGSIAGAILPPQVTGTDGRFRFQGVEESRVQVSVEAAGYLDQSLLHSPSDGALTITLDRGRELSGLVRDAEGKPAAGAQVRCGDRRTRTKADELGRFSVGGIEDPAERGRAPVFVAALHQGHAVGLIQPANLTGEGQVNVLRLERAAPLTGRVVDGDGEPVSGVRVRLRSERMYEGSDVVRGTPPSWESLFGEFDRRTGEDGRFEFTHRFPGPCTLRVTGRDTPEQGLIVPVGPAESEVEVQLDREALRGVVLEGRLVDERSGEPISAFRLLTWSEPVDGSRSATRHGASAGPDGSFRIEKLDEGTWELEFESEGYASKRLAPRAFEKGVHDLGEVAMAEAVHVRVEVLDRSGEHWAHVSLEFLDATGRPVEVKAGPFESAGVTLNGKPQLIEGLPALPLTAVVRGAGVRWEQSGIHMRSYAGQTLTLVVPRPEVGNLQVTFLDRASLGADADRVLGGFRQAIATMDQGWLMENREVLVAAFPKQGLQVRLVRGGTDVGSGEVAWLPYTETYRTSATAGSSGSSSEGSPFPDLRWSDLPIGEYEIVVTTESGATTTRAVAVRKAAEDDEAAPPVVVDY